MQFYKSVRSKNTRMIGHHDGMHALLTCGIEQMQISDEMVLPAPSAAVELDAIRPRLKRTHKGEFSVRVVLF